MSNTIDVNTVITGDTKNDLVAVVRCKDCQYARPEGRENVYICAAKTNPNYCWADDYCSCGERKETK